MDSSDLDDSHIDSNYEFDAPKDYFDFTVPMLNDSRADEWFDAKDAKNPTTAQEVDEDDDDDEFADAVDTTSDNEADITVVAVQRDADSSSSNNGDQDAVASPADRPSAAVVASSSPAVTTVESQQIPTNLRTGWGDAGETKQVKRKATNQAGPHKTRKTEPKTPSFMKRQKRVQRCVAKTTEELEMEEIEAKRKEFEQSRLRARRSFRRARSSSGTFEHKRSEKPLTEPKEFNFRTDERLRQRKSIERSMEERQPGPVTRSRTGALHKAKLPAVAPFKVASKTTKAMQAASEPFKPMALQLQEFSKKTPQRYRKPPAKEDVFKPQPRAQLKMTQPETPKFSQRTSMRKKAKSSAELEEEMMKSVKPFKAQPVNQRIMDSRGDYGVPRVDKRKPTKSHDVEFETDKRLQQREVLRSAAETAEEAAKHFEARPVPKHIFKAVVGVPERQLKEPTVAESPAITKSAPKTRQQAGEEQETEPKYEFHARPVPKFDKVFQPQHEAKHTEVQPFSGLESRPDPRKRREELEKEYWNRQQEEAHKFRANPMPVLDCPDSLPAVPVRMPTEPEPFALKTDEIGEVRRRAFEDKSRQEQEEELRKRQFKAKPAEVLNKVPFEAKKSLRPFTVLQEVTLSTDMRSKERAAFDAKVKEQEMKRQQDEERMRRLKEEEEAREIAKLRKEIVHKAQPVHHYKPVEIQPSDARLTEPHTPNFSARWKTRTSLRN